MGHESGNTVILYASQADPVWEVIVKDGAAFSKEVYVRRKYQESAPVFLTAYRWFVTQLPRFVPKPEGAEFPYWAFGDQYLMEAGYSSHVLTLEVPVNDAVYFDMQDWNKIIQLKYIGETEAQERAFARDLHSRGLDYADVMLTGFYPDLKYQIYESWQRLFRHHEAVKAGNREGIHSLQAGLWCIRKEWVLRDNHIPF